MPRVPSSAGLLFRLSGVGDPVGFVVHTSAFTAHSSAIPGKLWFLENLTRTLGTITFPERGLSVASHLVGLTVEGGTLRPHARYAGKTLVSEK